MTISEIYYFIDCHNEKRVNEYKVQANLVYSLAKLVSIGINDPQKFPKLNEIFPIFEEEEKKNEAQDWQVMKARIMQYESMKKMGKGGGRQ